MLSANASGQRPWALTSSSADVPGVIMTRLHDNCYELIRMPIAREWLGNGVYISQLDGVSLDHSLAT